MKDKDRQSKGDKQTNWKKETQKASQETYFRYSSFKEETFKLSSSGIGRFHRNVNIFRNAISFESKLYLETIFL